MSRSSWLLTGYQKCALSTFSVLFAGNFTSACLMARKDFQKKNNNNRYDSDGRLAIPDGVINLGYLTMFATFKSAIYGAGFMCFIPYAVVKAVTAPPEYKEHYVMGSINIHGIAPHFIPNASRVNSSDYQRDH